MVNLMTPENAALLIGAIAALVFALAKAVEWIGKGLGEFIKARADVKRTQAAAQARDSDAENEQQSKIINILERLADQNGRWPPIAEDFATAQNRTVEIIESFRVTNEEVAAGLQEMAKETKALRISQEAWPKTVDSTLAGLDGNILMLSKQVKEFEGSHEFIRSHLTIFKPQIERIITHLDEFKPQLEQIVKLLETLTPPPPPPAEAAPPKAATPLNADGAAHDTLAGLPKASGQ